MSCSSLQRPNTVLGWNSEPVSRHEAESLQSIRRLLRMRTIDLGELCKAISAVPRFAIRLRRLMNDLGAECANVNDAAVLAGRAGLLTVLDECSGVQSPLKQKKVEWGSRQTSATLVNL